MRGDRVEMLSVLVNIYKDSSGEVGECRCYVVAAAHRVLLCHGLKCLDQLVTGQTGLLNI